MRPSRGSSRAHVKRGTRRQQAADLPPRTPRERRRPWGGLAMAGVYGAVRAVRPRGPRITPMAPPPRREPGRSNGMVPGPRAAGRDRQPDGAEHNRLLDAAGQGEHEARESLATAHLDWVRSAARERADRGLSQDDLFQEGTIGLMEAIDGFRDSGSRDFEAYARLHIVERMESALTSEERACS